MSDSLTPITQIGKGTTTAYIPSDDENDKVRIDLDEYYQETEQSTVNAMVTGSEQYFNHGTLSKATARLMALTGCENFDPIPSRMNARMGGEGFVATIVEGFKKFIENIIKYIRMAVNWLIDLVKTITGYKKTKRQVKQAEEEMANIKKEFHALLTGLGFPADKFDLEVFLGDPQMSFDRMGAFQILRSKFTTDAEAIKQLGDSLPVFLQTTEYMRNASKKMGKARDNFHRVINQAAQNIRKGKTDGQAELELIKEAGSEIKLATNFNEIVQKLSELLTALYTSPDGKGVKEAKFSNEALQNGFMEIKASIQQMIVASTVSMSAIPDRGTLMEAVTAAKTRYQQLSDADLDLSDIDFKSYADIINMKDGDIIREIDKLTNVQGALISAYSSTAKLVRDYTQFCHGVMVELNKAHKQLESLWLWHNRSQQMIYFYVLKDLDAIIELNKQYQAAGMSPYANGEGIPRVDGFVNYDDRVTLFEKIAGTTNELLEANINGIKDAIKELSHQLGWTPR